MNIIKPVNRVFVTGDIHGDIADLADRVESMMATKDDLVIILGDCAFFYNCFYGVPSEKDICRQKEAAKLPCTILCVQGNHEQPFSEMAAEKVKIFDGAGYYSNGIYFIENGAEFTINEKTFLAIGGAYSIDKEYRLAYGYPWFEHEELSDEELQEVIDKTNGKKYDFILSHTTPYSNRPVEIFLDFVDQSKVSCRMENALEKIKQNTNYGGWFAGHYHYKIDGNVHLLFRLWEQII